MKPNPKCLGCFPNEEDGDLTKKEWAGRSRDWPTKHLGRSASLRICQSGWDCQSTCHWVRQTKPFSLCFSHSSQVTEGHKTEQVDPDRLVSWRLVPAFWMPRAAQCPILSKEKALQDSLLFQECPIIFQNNPLWMTSTVLNLRIAVLFSLWPSHHQQPLLASSPKASVTFDGF